MSPRQKRPRTNVHLTERSLSDLRGIELYSVNEWGRKTADKYLEEIGAAFDRLQQNPNLLRLEPGFAPGLFFYRVRKHVIVCDHHDETVIVLTVIHTSMDIPARLAELQPRLAAEAQFLHDKLHKKSNSG